MIRSPCTRRPTLWDESPRRTESSSFFSQVWRFLTARCSLLIPITLSDPMHVMRPPFPKPPRARRATMKASQQRSRSRCPRCWKRYRSSASTQPRAAGRATRAVPMTLASPRSRLAPRPRLIGACLVWRACAGSATQEPALRSR